MNQVQIERLIITAKAALRLLELVQPDAQVTWDLKVALKGAAIGQRPRLSDWTSGRPPILLDNPMEEP